MKQKRRVCLKKASAGFTITEIALVLGIIGVILGAIWAAAYAVYFNYRVDTAYKAIVQTVRSARALYLPSGSIGILGSVTDVTQELITTKMMPDNLVDGAVTTGPFSGGKLAVLATSDGRGFVVVLTHVPRDACAQLLPLVAGDDRDSTLYKADAVSDAPVAASDATTLGVSLVNKITPTIALAPLAGTAPSTYGGCDLPGHKKIRFGFALK